METWNLIPENIKSISLIPVTNPIQELTALGVGGHTYNRLVLGREKPRPLLMAQAVAAGNNIFPAILNLLLESLPTRNNFTV